MKKKIVLIVLSFICIIILISGFFYVRKEEKNKISSDEIIFSNLEKMNSSELVNIFYNTSTQDEFINEEEKNYRFVNKGADSVEDAIEKTKSIGQSSNTKMLELKLQKETEYYYVIYQEYISYRGTGDVIFKNSYVYLKNSVFDIDNKIINIDILNDSDKIKKIFNLYTYIKNNNASVKVLQPSITENSNEYIYTYYYFNISYGDWGMKDEIELYKSKITINKKDGKFEIIDKKIRQIEGKVNEPEYQ